MLFILGSQTLSVDGTGELGSAEPSQLLKTGFLQRRGHNSANHVGEMLSGARQRRVESVWVMNYSVLPCPRDARAATVQHKEPGALVQPGGK